MDEKKINQIFLIKENNKWELYTKENNHTIADHIKYEDNYLFKQVLEWLINIIKKSKKLS